MMPTEQRPSGATAEVLIQAAPNAVAMVDHHLRFLAHSPAWSRELALGDEVLEGRTIDEVFPRTHGRLTKMLEPALATATPLRSDAIWLPLRDGRRACLQLEASPWRRSDGAVGGLFLFLQDLTVASAALEGARRAERRLKVATEIAEIHVFEVDYLNRTLTTGGAENTFFETPPGFDEFEADPFCGVHELDRERVMAEVFAAAGAPGVQTTHRSEYRVRRSDDQEIWASSAVEFEMGPDGELSNAIFALQNVTQRKRAELALIVARDEAESANRAKSTFLAAMSHEIRTPMNGVLGMAQAMAADDLAPRQAERLAIVRQSGETLLAILNDILDLSKIEAGKLTLEDTAFDLTDLLRGVQGAFAARAAEKGLAFRLDIGPEAAGVYGGDPTRVKQVVYNLLSNAVKFTAHGHVSVDVARRPEGLVLKVTDTGEGMSPAVLERLFQKFEQADASTTRRYGGSGLGLAITRELAVLMGGQIVAESVEGQGTTFTVLLALPWLGQSAPTVRAEAKGGAATEQVGALRILAAEDNATNQKVICALLQQVGVEPVIANNGLEAVALWEQAPWDLILMDVQMPVLDGIEATRRIRAAEKASGRPRTPIVALTANAMSHQLDVYHEAGMDGVVAKPIEVTRLYAALEAALRDDQPPGETLQTAAS
jgi:PAS domain S-box-containing protein